MTDLYRCRHIFGIICEGFLLSHVCMNCVDETDFGDVAKKLITLQFFTIKTKMRLYW